MCDWWGSNNDWQSNRFLMNTISRSCCVAARIISTVVIINTFFAHCLPLSAEALLVCETITALCLLFILTFSSCSQPVYLLYLFLFMITIYDKDLSPYFLSLCPPFPSMSWRLNRTSYCCCCCCCSVSRECPTPCWGWGSTCLRSHTGKWPWWPKRPPGRRRCGRQQTTPRNRGCEKEKQRFKKLDKGRWGDCFLYLVGSKSCSQKYDMRVDRMMESDVAKPLRMLSAYLMTAAMTRPPSAWRKTNTWTQMDEGMTCTSRQGVWSTK